MAKDFAYDFYHSDEWIATREIILERDKYLCQHCLAVGKITTAKIVHHIIELTPSNINDPNITINPDNLVSVCDTCHKIAHNQIKRRAQFDADGNLIAINR